MKSPHISGLSDNIYTILFILATDCMKIYCALYFKKIRFSFKKWRDSSTFDDRIFRKI